MKALFLDIDGVLNSTRSTVVKIGPTVKDPAVLELFKECNESLPYGVMFGLKTADPVCVALLNRLLDETEASLVLSTHRSFFSDVLTYGSDDHLRLLRMYLEAMGVRVPTEFSVTPKLYGPRGSEVQAWLDGHDADVQYVILDDGKDFDDRQPLVWCDPVHGFSFDNYAEACKHLGADSPGLILL